VQQKRAGELLITQNCYSNDVFLPLLQPTGQGMQGTIHRACLSMSSTPTAAAACEWGSSRAYKLIIVMEGTLFFNEMRHGRLAAQINVYAGQTYAQAVHVLYYKDHSSGCYLIWQTCADVHAVYAVSLACRYAVQPWLYTTHNTSFEYNWCFQTRRWNCIINLNVYIRCLLCM